ncbi:hypothetical protein C1I95_28930 [Micromonospora craterilacus]|uniref:Uncharacterized protein n=1 Tax=Micromonospora craterilacus TaxID=1655439 RepID=A0A2W2DZ13_9ACTN|nr:hypothetical protein C1I95_28930 [Micromonospora craterilacus]
MSIPSELQVFTVESASGGMAVSEPARPCSARKLWALGRTLSGYGLEHRASYTMTCKVPQADGWTSGTSRTAAVHQDDCLI